MADGWMADDRRNTAYLYDARGVLADERYDKIHIVPFGEYLPFKSGFPPLYKLFLSLSPYTEDYTLTPGSENAITVFEVKSSTPPARFVTPICFEDIDPLLVGKMFRGGGGAKRADFIVNITNDGWFKFNEMPQHLQSAQFRSIENRAPTARSVNTGISGFVDSVGRTHGLIAAGIEGTSVQTLLLDRRSTVYTRWGDVFAGACIGVTLATAAAALVRRRRRRVAAGVTADQQAERST